MVKYILLLSFAFSTVTDSDQNVDGRVLIGGNLWTEEKLKTTHYKSENSYRQSILDTLFKNSFEYFQLLRNNKGIYRDALRFDGNHFHPASIATIGMGLVSLCIADSMGWIENADSLAELTLYSITGQDTNFFNPDRNLKGYYRHWIDMNNGEQAWNSEYSSIDTGILVACALFCKNYFYRNNSNENIMMYTYNLWESVDWSASIANPQTGGIYRELDLMGNGLANSITLPFNEYMIVAWLAKIQEEENNLIGDANELWDNHYEHPDSLPKIDYNGIPLLTDNPNSYLSNFIVQFTYYICNHFTRHEGYKYYMQNARKADSLWWAIETNTQSFEWGLGAGSTYNFGYHADAIDNNSDFMVSPHIIGGFLPIYEAGKNNLIELYEHSKGIYESHYTDTVLWRYSTVDDSYQLSDISGVDYSTMLFGLATLTENLGLDFFATYNSFEFFHLGDLNADGLINVIDVVLVVFIILNSPNEYNPQADLNNDGINDILDIVQLVELIIY